MSSIQVFDPPMCCSTGACGPKVDSKLVRFAADLEWLKTQGVNIQRFNLAQQPEMFVENETVKHTISMAGEECLPLVLVDGQIASQGSYPSREELASMANAVMANGKQNGRSPQSEGCCCPSGKSASRKCC